METSLMSREYKIHKEATVSRSNERVKISSFNTM